jgi:site-specific recombinase XerD
MQIPATLESAIDEFIQYLDVQKRASPQTIRAYSSDLSQWNQDLAAVSATRASASARVSRGFIRIPRKVLDLSQAFGDSFAA